MEKLITYFWFWWGVGVLILGVAGYNLAGRKYRNGVLWFFNCIFLGLLGLLVLACSASLENDEDDEYICDDSTDILGWWMFVIGLIWSGIELYYVWSFLKYIL